MLVRKNPEELIQLAFDRLEILSLFQSMGPEKTFSLRVEIESFEIADRAKVFLEAGDQRTERSCFTKVPSRSCWSWRA